MVREQRCILRELKRIIPEPNFSETTRACSGTMQVFFGNYETVIQERWLSKHAWRPVWNAFGSRGHLHLSLLEVLPNTHHTESSAQCQMANATWPRLLVQALQSVCDPLIVRHRPSLEVQSPQRRLQAVGLGTRDENDWAALVRQIAWRPRGEIKFW